VNQVAKVAHEHLEHIYKTEFPLTENYRELVLKLHDNVIEYNFLTQAGMLKSDTS
jgi:hypothetical protein